MASQPNVTTDDLVDIISDPILDAGVGLAAGREAARSVLALLSARQTRRQVRAWLDETDSEVVLLHSILAKLHETGPAGRAWGEVVGGALCIDEQEHGEGVRFDLTKAQVAAFERAK